MLKLEDLQVDTHVAGIEPPAPVKLLGIKEAGEDAGDVTHERLDGRLLKRTLFRVDSPHQGSCRAEDSGRLVDRSLSGDEVMLGDVPAAFIGKPVANHSPPRER